MATLSNWQELASKINAIKASRNSAKGYPGTSVANANTSSGDIEIIVASITPLIIDIDTKDDTKYSLSGRGDLSEEKYYVTADLQRRILEKKLFLNPWCSSYTTCKPYTITNCNPNIYNCGSTCGCQSQCEHSCSCQSQCGYSPCGCFYHGYCLCEGDISCCDGDCSDSCCDGDCSDSCCDAHCSNTTCPSNCTANTPCPSNCGCHNVCGCVFV